MPRILVIDDDAAARDSVSRMLRSAGHTVHEAALGEEGVTAAKGGVFDVILSDLQMPGLSGLEVLQRLRDAHVDSVFIIMTGFGTVESAVEAMRLGAVDFIQKPFLRDELLMRVRAAADRRQLARQVGLLQKQIRQAGTLESLVGSSEPIARIKDLVRRASAASGTVLITGETGTGKELVARAIHTGSARARGPFVPLNCAAVTESLLENELFGHSRGAFTGAAAPRTGLVEHASGGTLFLDEIGAMPLALQAKLLRAVESGEVRRVGENEGRKVDVRFVAATNVDLRGAVDRGEFRSDLYYRLDVHRIHLPPLRERPGDIQLLVEHFLKQYGGPVGVTGCTGEAMSALAAYSYPGNVRELEHIIQRAVAVAPAAEIDHPDLPEELLVKPSLRAASDKTVTAARERVEREMIVAALARHDGEIAAAARDLQVSRTTMWRLMKKHNVSQS